MMWKFPRAELCHNILTKQRTHGLKDGSQQGWWWILLLTDKLRVILRTALEISRSGFSQENGQKDILICKSSTGKQIIGTSEPEQTFGETFLRENTSIKKKEKEEVLFLSDLSSSLGNEEGRSWLLNLPVIQEVNGNGFGKLMGIWLLLNGKNFTWWLERWLEQIN